MAKPDQEQRLSASLAHLSPALGLVIPFIGHLLGPLLFYLAYKRRAVFVRAHAAEAFNFQATVTMGLVLLWVVGFALIVVKLGFLISWGIDLYHGSDSFEWPAWPELGGWVLLALIGLFISAILFVVLWCWNVIEILTTSWKAWKGERAHYTFIVRPIKVRWDEETGETEKLMPQQ